MKKILSRLLVILLALIVGLFIIGLWILHEAFGPKKRTVTINLPDGKTLMCNETYNADLAAVFYDIDFKLKDNKKEEFNLGSASYSNQNWDKELQLKSLGDWYLLPAKDGPFLKLLSVNRNTHKNIDTTLSPQTLRYDSLWKSTSNDIPAWTYGGTSILDSMTQNKLFVTYNYRFGLYEPFKFYSQTIEYEFDTINGQLITKKVFEAKEK